MRVSALQVWPEFMYAHPRPAGTMAAKSASSSSTLGDLPPSSSATRLIVVRGELGHAPTRARGAGERHHVDVGVRGDRLPHHRAEPVTRLNTPGGKPRSSMISARMNALTGATSDGFSTTVQPAASAYATLAAIWLSG